MIGACTIGKRRLLEVVARYGAGPSTCTWAT